MNASLLPVSLHLVDSGHPATGAMDRTLQIDVLTSRSPESSTRMPGCTMVLPNIPKGCREPQVPKFSSATDAAFHNLVMETVSFMRYAMA